MTPTNNKRMDRYLVDPVSQKISLNTCVTNLIKRKTPIKNKKSKTNKNSNNESQQDRTTPHQPQQKSSTQTKNYQQSDITSLQPSINPLSPFPSNPNYRHKQHKSIKGGKNPSSKHRTTPKCIAVSNSKSLDTSTLDNTQDSNNSLLNFTPFPKKTHRKLALRSK
jgi:hypothetical protein